MVVDGIIKIKTSECYNVEFSRSLIDAVEHKMFRLIEAIHTKKNNNEIKLTRPELYRLFENPTQPDPTEFRPARPKPGWIRVGPGWVSNFGRPAHL